MDFFTHIDISESFIDISYQDQILLFGSCFAESIGKRLNEYKFHVDINPFGVLYNPLSISTAISSLIKPIDKTKDDLFLHNGLYHSFTHHSSFSAITETECLEKINHRIQISSANLKKANRLFITFGSAHVYLLKSNGEIVANCHKLPSRFFEIKRLSVTDIFEEWDRLLSSLFKINKQLNVIFTVSPIRYWKDGAHENQLSKSTLLLAIDEIQKHYPNQISYFPAYELLMDELRDYRFYAEDMCHPSVTAVQYIWERFIATYFNQPTQQLLMEVKNILKAIDHKPFNPESQAHKQFVTQTLLKIEQLVEKTPYLCFEREINKLRESI